jgi:hypothetical protein
MHKPKVIPLQGGGYVCRCTCGASSGEKVHRQEAEDWVLVHDKEIERIRTHLATKTPRLQDERDYYRSKADDPDETPANRAIWKQLAEELSNRLNDDTPPDEGQMRLL